MHNKECDTSINFAENRSIGHEYKSENIVTKDSEPSPSIIYDKDRKIEDVDNTIVEILSEAIYSYIIRKRLLKKEIASYAK